MNYLIEGSCKLLLPKRKLVTLKDDVFYNPIMKHNRDISLAVVSTLTNPLVLLPMEASGVRGIRMVREIGVTPIMNDISEIAVLKMNEQCNYNNVKIPCLNQSSDLFLLSQNHADYIDIDPFGSPNQFLDIALKRMKKKGILAITATDVAALCGTSMKACVRKYGSVPSRTMWKHEFGLRILIHHIQKWGAMYDLYCEPILCYYKQHYFRCYFKIHKSKDMTFEVIQKYHSHLSVDGYKWKKTGTLGPIYTGPLSDTEFVSQVQTQFTTLFSKEDSLLNTIQNEVDSVGYYHVNELGELFGVSSLPPMKKILEQIPHSSRTHFTPEGFKTTASIRKIKKVFGV